MFEGQYNDKHKEVELKYSVILNFVVPKDTSEDNIDKWFQGMVSALGTGVQIQKGQMNQITITKL